MIPFCELLTDVSRQYRRLTSSYKCGGSTVIGQKYTECLCGFKRGANWAIPAAINAPYRTECLWSGRSISTQHVAGINRRHIMKDTSLFMKTCRSALLAGMIY